MRARLVGFGAALTAVLALPTLIAAQQGSIVGRVVDSRTGAPISGVQAEVMGGVSAGGVVSDAQGAFSLRVGPGTYAIAFTYIGHAPKRIEGVRVGASGTTDLGVVALDQTALSVDEIVVSVMPGVRQERQLEAPTHVEVVGETQIAERATTNAAEHLRSTPGVDVIQQGVQSSNVAVRGFNNVFSGALHMLSDHRLAGVPSLKVNLLHFLPATNEDIQRIEVVLGPGAALYGPNTANGVMHIITRSPLIHQGTTVSLSGGERSVLQGGFRTAHLLSENLGVKLSGQYLQGEEWPYVDSTEVANRDAADDDPAAFRAEVQQRGFSPATAEAAYQRVGRRDFDLSRWALDARADWRFSEQGTLVLSSGRSSSTGVELTGLGPGQTNNWVYSFYQARASIGRLFTQAYLNTSDAGDSFLLRDGVPLVDKSKLFVTQVQHGFDTWAGRQQFTYGVDYFRTMPNSEGTVWGKHEDDDLMTEWGVYAQSETALTPKLDLVLAGRVDSHSELEDDVFSPRAALVIKPTREQSIRLTYNRAYSQPTALNFFLDVSAGRFPVSSLAALGYRGRAQGVGSTGFYFRNEDGSLKGMRSPFNPTATGGPAALLPVSAAANFWPAAVMAGAQGAAAAGTPFPTSVIQVLSGLRPTSAQIGVSVFDLLTRTVSSVAEANIPDVPRTVPEESTTFEIGYQGVLGGRFKVAADVWHAKKNDLISPLTIRTPLLLLNGPQVGAYLQASAPQIVAAVTQDLINSGMEPAQAQQTAQAQAPALIMGLATAIGGVPVGVVSEENIDASGADIVVTYYNAGTVRLWGADLGFEYFLNDAWTLGGSASVVSDYYFDSSDDNVELEGGSPVSLNAPKAKGSLSLTYRSGGFNAEGRVRHTGEFPAVSAGYTGTGCIPTAPPALSEEDCVPGSTLLDLSAGYQIPRTGATVQLAINNLLDVGYRSFVGVPEIGRFALLRVKYDLR